MVLEIVLEGCIDIRFSDSASLLIWWPQNLDLWEGAKLLLSLRVARLRWLSSIFAVPKKRSWFQGEVPKWLFAVVRRLRLPVRRASGAVQLKLNFLNILNRVAVFKSNSKSLLEVKTRAVCLKRISFLAAVTLTLLCSAGMLAKLASGQEPQETPPPQAPDLVPASNEGQEAIAQFDYLDNLTCELFSAEPDVANIVAFHRDYRGDMYVCETFRQGKGVEDNRNHGDWLDEDLAAQTVQDRIDYIRKHIADADQSYTANDDRIRLLRDTDGNGSPDSNSIFSDRYNKIEMGTGAGVLSYRGKVYYTCIPDLFELRDTDGDGVADVRKSLQSGYGIKFAFRGHDMHGLIVGPDGRLYFSIGDRGYNISPAIKDTESGAVFRCELDGSNLEVVATGLRNPQELAFDDYGNLFSGENNSDSGDQARWVEIVKGSDSGWRMYYQYQADRGPFNREKIWQAWHEESPAYIVPPIANIADGPAGLEYYPGTGFGDAFKGQFFLCDFRGSANISGVRSFKSQPEGAFWKLVQSQQPIWKMLATDIDFGSDGKLYVSDWVLGWNGENKGRIYAFHDPEHVDSPLVKEVEALLKSGLKQQATVRLKELLAHQDQRVRQEAQFELVDRGAVDQLVEVAVDPEQDQLARIHSVWGLGQLLRGKALSVEKAALSAKSLASIFDDQEWQVVAAAVEQAAETTVDATKLAGLLTHDNLRVRFKAAMSLARVGTPAELPAIRTMLVENGDADPMVRHGGIMALNGIFTRTESNAVLKLAADESRSVRVAVCVAMRKLLESNETGIYRHRQSAAKLVGGLLEDDDSRIVLEAARIIHDLEVKSELAKLAGLISSTSKFADFSDLTADALVRRVVSANVRVGAKANAEALVKFACDETSDIDRRVEAVAALGTWAKPSERMMVLEAWRPLDPKKRNVIDARNAVESEFKTLTAGSDKVTRAAIEAAGTLNLISIGGALEEVVLSNQAQDETRTAALQSLAKIKYKNLDALLIEVESGYDSLPPGLAAMAIDLVAGRDEERGVELIKRALQSGEQSTKQSAIKTLGNMQDVGSAELLSSLIRRSSRGELAVELRLDVTDSAASREDESVKKLLAAYQSKITKPGDKGSAYVDALAGGNVEAGSKIFTGKTEVSCVRCHKIDGNGGEVGPDLSGIGLKRDRKYLMEAIVDPNKEIAEGFAQVKVQTDLGELHVGIVHSETDELLVLMDADGKLIRIEQDSIEGRKTGQSSMPDDLIKSLTKKEVRDLVEFLASCKAPVAKETTGHE